MAIPSAEEGDADGVKQREQVDEQREDPRLQTGYYNYFVHATKYLNLYQERVKTIIKHASLAFIIQRICAI